jgi:hypothetical protein
VTGLHNRPTERSRDIDRLRQHRSGSAEQPLQERAHGARGTVERRRGCHARDSGMGRLVQHRALAFRMRYMPPKEYEQNYYAVKETW